MYKHYNVYKTATTALVLMGAYREEAADLMGIDAGDLENAIEEHGRCDTETLVAVEQGDPIPQPKRRATPAQVHAACTLALALDEIRILIPLVSDETLAAYMPGYDADKIRRQDLEDMLRIKAGNVRRSTDY